MTSSVRGDTVMALFKLRPSLMGIWASSSFGYVYRLSPPQTSSIRGDYPAVVGARNVCSCESCFEMMSIQETKSFALVSVRTGSFTLGSTRYASAALQTAA